MKAIVQRALGGPEVLVLDDVPDLVPGEGQARIAVAAAGVHLLDTMLREGHSGPFGPAVLPMVPGREVAGVVDAVGPGVDGRWLGQTVAAHLGPASGGYAEQALATAELLMPLAEDTDPAEAVAMVGTGRTSLAVLEEADLAPEDVVLITAAAGGIGSLLVQAIRAAGATSVALAGGPVKVALVESLGADIAVDYCLDDWPEQVRAALGEQQVTVALDGVGGTIGRSAFELVAPGGRMVLFGYTAGDPMPLCAEDLFERGVALTAAIGPRLFARPGGGPHAFAVDALERLAAGWWRPVVTTFPLADAAGAHAALTDRATTGKVVLLH